MPIDPVKRKASQQAYDQSDKGKARKAAYVQSDKGQATAQADRQRAASAAAERALPLQERPPGPARNVQGRVAQQGAHRVGAGEGAAVKVSTTYRASVALKPCVKGDGRSASVQPNDQSSRSPTGELGELVVMWLGAGTQ
jgi:hypothetical protein